MKKSNWFWNFVIVLTLAGCILAFVLHYKNWVKIEEGNFMVTSGIYSQKIPRSEINGIEFVSRIPKMERKNGFSWLAKEKGVFLDSISGNQTYVFVDDLRREKLKMMYSDSLILYFNLADSLETIKYFETLNSEIFPTN